MKLSELVKVLGKQFIILRVENINDKKIINREDFYYDRDYTCNIFEKYENYIVTYVDAWDYEEIRIFIKEDK